MVSFTHTMPFGAEIRDDGSVAFRLWAPGRDRIDLVLPEDGGARLAMDRRPDGWFELATDRARAGSAYAFHLGEGSPTVPDPASRYQPDDVHGPSRVVDPRAFDWRHGDFRGRPWDEAVLYELHPGTFSPEGTFDGIRRRLDHLVDLGVTAVELMPLAEFPGRRNWGYDGVLPYAPDGAYGSPDDLKRLIDEAHGRGLMMFLDVVYNHFGPEGNYLHAYAPDFFTERHHTPWGAAINFDDANSRPVRDFFIHNALYWLQEYRFDGLRFDAVHAIIDDSDPDILCELAEIVRRRADAEGRHVHLVLENDDNVARYLGRDAKGRTTWYTAQWNDDYHHAAHVVATGEAGGYYADYADRPVDRLGRALAEGYVYQGDPSAYRDGEPRGTPSAHLPPQAFVTFLQNHDQIGNRAYGDRIAALAGRLRLRAMMEVTLLAPSPPMLFMGEEWGSTRPFYYFVDFEGDLADAVREGRRREFGRFPEFADPEARRHIPDPTEERTFARSCLDWSALDQADHAEWLGFVRALLRLRRERIVPLLPGLRPGAGWRVRDGRTLTVEWPLEGGGRLSLVANLGDAECGGCETPAGDLLFESRDGVAAGLAEGRMASWSVAWFAESPALPSR
ncbi:malto-oligosyltrehalose trehalohydrolase [Arenibaculum sp.]|jgi:maltooligosyltrehalose trehalohydrolase|uniref:malto-oligosyltrehalose trehalohydrolase n=1 Tax=Arenibaculum sp. TaxID=2865862 RepID=UPI002E11AF48|nr:malto-oligosyltrehalose trehalohydrolase [Arenibaculum sp.]